MKTPALVWTIIFVLGGAWLAFRTLGGDMGQGHVKRTEKEFVRIADVDELGADKQPTGRQVQKWVPASSPEASGALPDPHIRWTVYEGAKQREYIAAVQADSNQTVYQFSWSRTLGIWVAGLLTLCILSFLFGDNPFYKFAESVVVGSSAAYVMVTGFWSTIIGNLFGKLTPEMVRAWALPGMTKPEDVPWWLDQGTWYVIPLILSVMLLWRLAPKGAWIARWPLAFFIGATAGFRLVGFLGPDFVNQIGNTIIPFYVTKPDGGFDLWPSVKNIIIVLGVLACLVYFFFSIEHKGAVGRVAKLGIWFLMITFGAGFGYTVMGRIALLAERLQFLFDDWLWLIDPTGRRTTTVAQAGGMLVGAA